MIARALTAAVGWAVVAGAAAWAADPAAPPIRVVVAPIAVAAEWQGDRPVGAMVEIWDEIAARLGRRTEFVRVEKFTDEAGALAVGTADVALGPIAITAERERSFDLTHAVVHSGLRIAINEHRDTGVLAALRGLPVRQLLGLLAWVLGLALFSGHLLWWFERGTNPGSFPDRYPGGVWEAVWWIASTVVTGGCDNKHVASVLGRAIAFAWMLGGIVLAAAFTGVLAASMTAEKMTGSIHGVRDLTGHVVGCQEASVVVQVLRARGATPREYARMDEAIDALQAGTIDAVVGENLQLSALIGWPGRHDLVIVGSIFEVFDYGMALPVGSPLREGINGAILEMREDGVIARILDRWFGRHE
ncbi:MAG: transporter substrate-binding domain-containing protein [Planctomycetaceae bacterium]